MYRHNLAEYINHRVYRTSLNYCQMVPRRDQKLYINKNQQNRGICFKKRHGLTQFTNTGHAMEN